MKRPKTPSETILGHLLGCLIGGAIFTWYNHVIHWNHFAYWQWCVIAMGWAITTCFVTWPHKILGAVFVVVAIAQVAAWVGMIQLPLIKP